MLRVIDTDPEGWRDRLKEACDGKGPDVVFDPVCGPLFELAFRSQSWRGRHLVVGFVGGPIPKLPVNLALMKGARWSGKSFAAAPAACSTFKTNSSCAALGSVR